MFEVIPFPPAHHNTVTVNKKQFTPDALGASLYEALRAAMTSASVLSIERLLASIGKMPADLDEQYVGDIMIAVMFGATLSIERSTEQWIGERIVAGMQNEFFRHLEEQGATPHQVAEWRDVLANRFQEYRACAAGYDEGLEPPWKVGRQLYWLLTGTVEYLALPIKNSTLFVLAARDQAQLLMNEYGPHIISGVAAPLAKH
jgi:hypothetical protein